MSPRQCRTPLFDFTEALEKYAHYTLSDWLHPLIEPMTLSIEEGTIGANRSANCGQWAEIMCDF